MQIDPSTLWLPCTTAFVLAGFVKGATGMGLPTVVMVLLAGVMPVPAAAALLVLPSLVTNAQQVLAGPGAAVLLRRLWPMFATMALFFIACMCSAVTTSKQPVAVMTISAWPMTSSIRATW